MQYSTGISATGTTVRVVLELTGTGWPVGRPLAVAVALSDCLWPGRFESNRSIFIMLRGPAGPPPARAPASGG